MRKVEKEMLEAVRERKNWSSGNTRVQVAGNALRVFLFENHIYSDNMGCKSFSLAGWTSPTTISRLRALGVDVCIKKHTPMYDGSPIDSAKWYDI